MKKSGNKIDVLSFVHEVILLSYKDLVGIDVFKVPFV